MAKIELTQQLVKELFDYNDGALYWKVSRTVKIKVGQRAGWLFKTTRGTYRWAVRIGSNGTFYQSRIIFLYHKGWLPKMVDHKDRNTTNNRIENLRAANESQNGVNVTKKSNTTSKFLGVHLSQCKTTRIVKTTGELKSWSYPKWIAQITVGKKRVCLGKFDTEIEAAIAFNIGAKKHYGEFANLNDV